MASARWGSGGLGKARAAGEVTTQKESLSSHSSCSFRVDRREVLKLPVFMLQYRVMG